MDNQSVDEIVMGILRKLAEDYGYKMELYGKSHYWSSPRVIEFPTPELEKNEIFKSLPEVEQNKILEYGSLREKWGAGSYLDSGACAKYYDKGIPPTNPYDVHKNEYTL